MSTLSNENEIFDIFNEQGEHVGTEKRSTVHRRGLMHRAVNVLVLDGGGRVLVQRRHGAKRVCGGRWDLSCAEHNQPGEGFAAAAARGLGEELGLRVGADELRLAWPLHHWREEYPEAGIVDHEWNELYLLEGYAEGRHGAVCVDAVEVTETRWLTPEEVTELCRDVGRVTPWFIRNWKYLQEKKIL